MVSIQSILSPHFLSALWAVRGRSKRSRAMKRSRISAEEKGMMGSELAKDAVHSPIGGGGTEAIAVASADTLNVFHDVSDDRKLC